MSYLSVIKNIFKYILLFIAILLALPVASKLECATYYDNFKLPKTTGFIPVTSSLDFKQAVDIDKDCQINGISLVFTNPNKEQGSIFVTAARERDGRVEVFAKRRLEAGAIADSRETRVRWPEQNLRPQDRLILGITTTLKIEDGVGLLADDELKDICLINNESMDFGIDIGILQKESVGDVLHRMAGPATIYPYPYLPIVLVTLVVLIVMVWSALVLSLRPALLQHADTGNSQAGDG